MSNKIWLLLRLWEPQLHTAVAPVRPAADDHLAASAEANAIATVHVTVAEDRALPTSERVVGHRNRYRNVDPDHADLNLVLEPTRCPPVVGENCDPVGVRVGIDERERFGEGPGAHHAKHRTEDLVSVNRHRRRDAVEETRAQKETA